MLFVRKNDEKFHHNARLYEIKPLFICEKKAQIMTQSNKRKQAKNTRLTTDRVRSSQIKLWKPHVMRVFMMYFVIFGTILAFVGLMGDDGLPGSGMVYMAT